MRAEVPATSADAPRRLTGRVQSFDRVRRFGFILGDDGFRYFVGGHAIRGYPRVLSVGECVAFWPIPTPQGPEAHHVYRTAPPTEGAGQGRRFEPQESA
jgi:cold shock CspA family protein